MSTASSWPPVEEERFNRIKHGKEADFNNPHQFPERAVRCCLNHARLTAADIDHVAYSFSRKSNPCFHELLSCFFAQTGVPLVVNTSFNDSEPIVCTPTDAIVTFRKSGIDALIMDDVVLTAQG